MSLGVAPKQRKSRHSDLQSKVLGMGVIFVGLEELSEKQPL